MQKSPHYAEAQSKFERSYTPERLAADFICHPERLSEYGYNTDWLAMLLGIARPYPEDVRHFLQNKLTYARRRACRHWRKVLGTGQTRYFVAYGAPAPTVCAGTVTNSLPRLAYPGKRPVYMARLVADGREVVLDYKQVYATAAGAQAAADAYMQVLLDHRQAYVTPGKTEDDPCIQVPPADMVQLHSCKSPGDSIVEGYDIAIDQCWQDETGRLWVGNGEYANTVKFCPFCGYSVGEQMIVDMPGTRLPAWPLMGAKKVTDLTYYDGPLASLFVWKGSRYVYLWVDQVEDGHRWLVYRITVAEVYSQRRLGVIAPPPADPLVYLVDLGNEAQPLRCAVLMPHELPDAYMPESGFIRLG